MKKAQRQKVKTVQRSPGDPLDLNLRSLDIFVQIAEIGGMSTAARRMGLSQSAVSQLISNLETSLGVQLFDRQVRPLALTPSGVILLEKARRLLLSARDVIFSVRQPAALTIPKLNLYLVDTIAGTIAPNLVAGLQGVATHWAVHSGVSSMHSRVLQSRAADVVVSSDPMEDEPNLERHQIMREPFFLAVPKSYRGPVNNLEALAQRLDLIRFSTRSLLGRQVERHLRRQRINAPGRVELDTSDAVLAMVTSNLGWALITPLCAMLAPGYWAQARFVPMPEPLLHRRMYVIARQGELGELPQKIAEVAAEALRANFRQKLEPHYPWMVEAIELNLTAEP